MKVIGIAGASGTGKSTVAAHLERRGGVRVDADRIAHDLLAHDRGVIESVRARIGDDVFGADGRIDRKLLGAKVFSDAALLKRLNAITHPRIRERCGEAVRRAREAGAAFVVVDAALLLDSQMPFEFDLLIALRCPEEVRLRRIVAKGGWSEDEVRRRLASQRSIEKSFYKAHAVVDTDGDEKDTLNEIDELVDAALGRPNGERP